MNLFVACLLFISFVICSNPFFYVHIPPSYILITLLLVVLAHLSKLKKPALRSNVLTLFFLAGPLLLAYLGASLYSSDALSIPLYLVLSLAAVFILPFFSILLFVRLVHIYSSCLVLGALMMVFYQLLGGSSMFAIDATSRFLQFFPISFSDSQLLTGFYRPSSMFDEPGTFACFLLGVLAIISTNAYRSYYSTPHWFFSTTLLVVGGLASLSFAFYVCLILGFSIALVRRFAVNYNSFLKIRSLRLTLIFSLLFLVMLFCSRPFIDLSSFLDYFLDRLSFFQFNSSSSDSGRYTGLLASLSFLADRISFFPDSLCLSNEAYCGELNWNPLYYVVRDGMLGSLSTLMFAILLSMYYIRSNNVWSLSFMLFFLQRTNWFYSWIALLSAVLIGFILIPRTPSFTNVVPASQQLV